MVALLQAAPSTAHAMDLFHRLWAYVMLGVTGIITEEATPLIGGLAAHDHRLRLSAVGLWVAGGTWVADLSLYYVGRWRGHWARHRWPQLRRFMLQAFRIVRRHPWRSALAVRWGYGLRVTLPIACGAGRLPLGIYLIGKRDQLRDMVVRVFGSRMGVRTNDSACLGHVRRYENYLIASIVLVLVMGFWFLRKRHVEDEVVDVLAAGDEPLQ